MNHWTASGFAVNHVFSVMLEDNCENLPEKKVFRFLAFFPPEKEPLPAGKAENDIASTMPTFENISVHTLECSVLNQIVYMLDSCYTLPVNYLGCLL